MGFRLSLGPPVNADPATVSSSGRSTAVVWWVAPILQVSGGTYFTIVRRMLQELEAEDGARQSGAVDRLGRHQTFQFEEMERELLAGGGALSRSHETTSIWRAWPVSARPSPKWIERPKGDEGHGGRTIRGKLRHSEQTSKIYPTVIRPSQM